MSFMAIHVVLLLVVPPLLPGVINKTKAFFAGRRGPPLFQLYYDLAKLARKDVVLSQTTTWIFLAAPGVILVSVLLAGLLVPIGPLPAPVSFAGDLVLFAYLLGVGRFFLTAAALDTGSAFEGMGAAREVTFACLAEPALFFALLVLARMSGSLALADLLYAPLAVGSRAYTASLVLVAAGLFLLLLAENSRIPVDDPNTHLELTMIHEVMILDHSGPLLGLLLYGASVKLFVFSAVLWHVVFPFRSGGVALDGALFVAGVLLISVIIGIVESGMARLQMRHVPHFLVAAILFCGFGFLLLMR